MSTLTLVYDAQDKYPPKGGEWFQAWMAWLRQHGVEPLDTTRVEFHTIDDAPFIRVFQLAKNAEGDVYLDLATDDVARRPPFDVLITTPAPRPEDYR